MSFLTDADLAILTGRKQGKRQADQLRRMGIPHYLRDGRPVVTWEAVNGRERRKADPFKFEMVR